MINAIGQVSNLRFVVLHTLQDLLKLHLEFSDAQMLWMTQ
jgi:hypothetical protein